MKRLTLAVILVAGTLLLSTAAIGLVLHSLLHLEWRVVGIVCLLTLACSSVTAVDGFQRVLRPTRKTRMQRIAHLCSPFVFGIFVYVGWSCGYPRAGGTVGFAVFAAAFVYYHLGRGVPNTESGQGETSENNPDASPHDRVTD